MALDLVRKRGKYTQIGLFGKPIEIDFEKIAFREIVVNGTVSQRRPAWKRTLGLMERGVIRNERLVSTNFRSASGRRVLTCSNGSRGSNYS